MKAELLEKSDRAKENSKYQEEIMAMINQLYEFLASYFETPSIESAEVLIKLLKERFLLNSSFDQIITTFREVSSDKFRNVHGLDHNTLHQQDYSDVSRILLAIQQSDRDPKPVKRESPLKRKGTIESDPEASNPMTESQQSLSSLKAAMRKIT